MPALHLGLQCTLKALTRPLNFFPLHWKAAALFQKSKLVNTRTPFPEPREFPPIPFQTPPDSKKAEGGHALGEERGLRPRVAGEVTPRSRDAEGAACGWGTGRGDRQKTPCSAGHRGRRSVVRKAAKGISRRGK